MAGSELGRVVEFEQGLRWRVLFPEEEHFGASGFLRDLAASDCSPATLRSYAYDLLRWFRFLHERWTAWKRAERTDVREFVERLRAWRTRALPLDPTEKAVQQAILRAFATTGHPPAPSDLHALTAGSGRGTTEILTTLHDVDAIQLAPNGHIALAYPFSATPTRHRVRIDDRVDVYAMCAIDALGIAAMLDQDTRIESFDVTTGEQITVTTTAGRAVWEPAGAVVFVGADAGGGPSADYCCDYLNFFASNAAAEAWTTEHPQVPGQILNQAEAEELGNRLFGHLLTTA